MVKKHSPHLWGGGGFQAYVDLVNQMFFLTSLRN